MIQKVAFTMYPAIELERTRAFYEETLGLTVGLHGGRNGIFWLEYDLPGGGCIALSNATGDTPGGGGTIALEVADLDALIADLKAKGVRFKSDVIHGPKCRMATCVDSEGNSLLLHQLNEKAARTTTKKRAPSSAR